MDNKELNELEGIDILDKYNNYCFFEEDYEDIKLNPNLLWFEYEVKIKKVINNIAYAKNFDSKELMQEAYIYFIEFSKIYDPYYNGAFIPFDKFLFKNLIIKLRAYIQRYYFKGKREQPSELSEYYSNPNVKNNINELEEKIYVEHLYSKISEAQKEILELSINGYKQKEIGELLGISQSRVSVIKNKTLKKLNDIIENKNVKKRKTKKF